MQAKRSLLFICFTVIIPSLVGCETSRHTKQADTREVVRKDASLSLMTYNIRVGAGREKPLTPVKYLSSSREKLEAIALAIKSVDADVIALQEVRGSAQAKFLADTLNLNYAYVSHGDFRLEWGLAVLSKFSILEYYGKSIYHHGKKPRVGLVCLIDANNSPITVINVHYNLGAYAEQVEATVELLQGVNGPVILMGDLNLINPTRGLVPIRTKLIDTCEAVNTKGSQEARQRGTYKFSSRRLDYIFVDPNQFVVIDAGLAPETYRRASDHIAYFAWVTPKNGESAP